MYLDNSNSYLNSSGILYINYNNQNLPICCNPFTLFDADSTCRQLGYTQAALSPQPIRYKIYTPVYKIELYILYSPAVPTWKLGRNCNESSICLKICFGKYNLVKELCYVCNVTCSKLRT